MFGRCPFRERVIIRCSLASPNWPTRVEAIPFSISPTPDIAKGTEPIVEGCCYRCCYCCYTTDVVAIAAVVVVVTGEESNSAVVVVVVDSAAAADADIVPVVVVDVADVGSGLPSGSSYRRSGFAGGSGRPGCRRDGDSVPGTPCTRGPPSQWAWPWK